MRLLKIGNGYGKKIARYLRFDGKGVGDADSEELALREVRTKGELEDFVKFNIDLYDGHPYHVPSLMADDLNLLLPEKNPAHAFCDTIYLLAYRGRRIVGRIAGIINHRANDKWGQNRARFGFVDFEDDPEAVDALFGAVEDWARSQGCDEIHGPLGFTDLDREGMLIEGFHQLGTMSTIYNFSYYPTHMERIGYTKDTDWLEYKIYAPKAIPERHKRMSDLVRKKYGLRVVKYTDRGAVLREYGDAIFELLNISYSHLYGVTELTYDQIQYYKKQYISLLNLELVPLVVRDSDKALVGFGVALPSLARAFQKANGRLWPTGIVHLLRALKSKTPGVIDLMLIAVHPDYQQKGVNALIFEDLIPIINEYQVKYVESNPELEDNRGVQAQWNDFKKVHHKTRRAYVKKL